MNGKIMSLLVCGACAMSAQAAAENASTKVDVLGRHVSEMRNVPDAYVKNIKKQVNQDTDLRKESPKKPKSLARWASYPYPSEVDIQANSGEFRYKAFKGSRKYILNGDTISESTYLTRINQIEESDAGRYGYVHGWGHDPFHLWGNHNFVLSSTTANTCANQDFCDLGRVWMNAYYGGTENITAATFPYVAQNISNLNALYNTGAQGNGIGVYFLAKGAPSTGVIPSNKLIYGSDCDSDYKADNVIQATQFARAINTVAPGATIHSYANNCAGYVPTEVPIPYDGFYREPQMHIGNVSFTAISVGTPNNYYSQKASVLDDIVYNTRQIQFAGAGDYGAPNGDMNEYALSLNAITVGAVHKDGSYYLASSWKNGVHPQSGMTYVKPEIANVGDFFFSNPTNPLMKGSYGEETRFMWSDFLGTASASTYTAATVALLLEKYPFYRWHPEVVKALLLTSSTLPIPNASHDQDNGVYAANFLDASKLIGKNHSRFWNGNNGDYFVNGPIEFDEKDIKANKKYRVAISWLVSGEYVLRSGALPFDLDIEVLQDGQPLGSSISDNNPFEMVEFTTRSANKLTIKIRRYYNNGGRVLLGYNLAEL